MKGKFSIDTETMDLVVKACKIYKIRKRGYPSKIKAVCEESIKKFFYFHEMLITILTNTFQIIDKHCPEVLNDHLEIIGAILIKYRELSKERKNAEKFK